jgi:hypothetical protein
MKIFSGTAAPRPAVPAKAESPQATRSAAPSPAKEPPRQDKVATAYRIERPMPQPRPNAPRGSTVNLLV